MIINVVMKVTEREGDAVVCPGWRDLCVLPTKTPIRMERVRTRGGVGCQVWMRISTSFWVFVLFFFTDLHCARASLFQPSGSIVWLGAMTTTRALLRSLYPADLSSCVISSV